MAEPLPLLHEINDRVLTVTFNRPEKYNALTREMIDLLWQCVDRFRRDDDLRVMLITGRGKYYSAGVDLTGGIAPETESGIEFRDWYRNSFHRLFDELEAIEKPIVAAIQGPCFGGALEMALSCDFRLAASSANFALPETNIGVLPGSGGVSRLTRLVGIPEAKWLVMAARKITAERALRVGLVQEVYPDDGFQEACQTFATELAALPREVLGAGKLAIELAHDLDRASARQVERLANTPLSQSREHRDLVDAFNNRKK